MRKVAKVAWTKWTDWDTVCKRAAGRAHYNSIRTYRAELRRGEVLQLLQEWGWGHGTQARIARCLGVSAATVSRDVARILPLYTECRHCGWLRPRHWAMDD